MHVYIYLTPASLNRLLSYRSHVVYIYKIVLCALSVVESHTPVTIHRRRDKWFYTEECTTTSDVTTTVGFKDHFFGNQGFKRQFAKIIPKSTQRSWKPRGLQSGWPWYLSSLHLRYGHWLGRHAFWLNYIFFKPQVRSILLGSCTFEVPVFVLLDCVYPHIGQHFLNNLLHALMLINGGWDRESQNL